jgi:hypothetical protein
MRSRAIPIVLIFCSVFGTYSVLEIVTTYRYLTAPPVQYWVNKNCSSTVRLDLVRGHFLSAEPCHEAQITYGKLEYLATLRGNNQGFNDSEDFFSQQPKENIPRIAVFGDSFTAGHFLKPNWPDRVQALSQKTSLPIQILNFSIDGGGLANWESIIRKIVVAENYDLDGIVFAVLTGNLRRRFTYLEYDPDGTGYWKRSESWDPLKLPQTITEARKILQPFPGSYGLSSKDFDKALKGEWHPSSETRPFRLELWHMLTQVSPTKWMKKEDVPEQVNSVLPDPGQWLLTDEIRELLQKKKIPILVVHIPLRSVLLGEANPPWGTGETQAFANRLGGQFVDGTEAFLGMRPNEVRAHWLPHDWHWNQKGSDRFSDFISPILSEFAGRKKQLHSKRRTPNRLASSTKSRG